MKYSPFRQVIDLIKIAIPSGPQRETVDTLKIGNPDQPVKGIVTTMFATVEVIQKAIALGANFIIAHEPTFYNHLDNVDWLEQHEVYQHKRDLAEKNNIVIWRFHDFIHANRPDGVQMGVLTALGWEKYADRENLRIVTLPQVSLIDIIKHVKDKLGIPTLRYMGDPKQVCKRIALMPGASGGRSQITALNLIKPDVLICGELQEWETSEYIRDARAMGLKHSLIVLGHTVSEEPGMKWLVSWLQPRVPGVAIIHVPSQNPFSWA